VPKQQELSNRFQLILLKFRLRRKATSRNLAPGCHTDCRRRSKRDQPVPSGQSQRLFPKPLLLSPTVFPAPKPAKSSQPQGSITRPIPKLQATTKAPLPATPLPLPEQQRIAALDLHHQTEPRITATHPDPTLLLPKQQK